MELSCSLIDSKFLQHKPRIRRSSAFLVYKTRGYHGTSVIKNVMSFTVPAFFFHIRFLLQGEPTKQERPPSISSQTNHQMDNFQEEKQNRSETLDQSMAGCSEQYKRECAPEDEDRTKTKQDIPVAFAIPAHEVSFATQHSISCCYLGKHHVEESAKETKLE